MSRHARNGIKALKKPMEELHVRSTAFSRTDEFDPSQATKGQIKKESGCPWVVHAAACLTEQAPNEDGVKGYQFCDEPVLKFWVASEQAKLYMKDFFDKKNAQVELHTSHSAYMESFQSESGKKKKHTPPKNKLGKK